MILILDNGKTNQLGNLEDIGVMRHRDPLLCTMGQVAFYLFHCWEGELPPQIWTRQQWYGTHFRTLGLSYEGQLRWFNNVFNGVSSLPRRPTSWKGRRRIGSDGLASGTGTP
jgi:centromere DNA-binding complex CBF3 subunit-like protein